MYELPCLWESFDTMDWENTKKKFVGYKSTLLKAGLFGPQNTKDSRKFIKGKKFRDVFNFFIFKQFSTQNRMTGCDCWGPDGRLDTKVDKFVLCHIYMSRVIICHNLTYYDIWRIWHMNMTYVKFVDLGV